MQVELKFESKFTAMSKVILDIALAYCQWQDYMILMGKDKMILKWRKYVKNDMWNADIILETIFNMWQQDHQDNYLVTPDHYDLFK